MSLSEQQNFLARLYTDAELRRDFLSNPEKIGTENSLNVNESAEIAAIMPEELEFFAESLFWKRRREAEKMLPLTREVLGEDFTGHFREFSKNFNPQSVKKHFEDALGFSEFLQTRMVSEAAKTAARYERARLEFFGLEKRFAICRLDYDVRKITAPGLKRAKKIAVWLRFGKRIRHFFI